MKLTSNHFVERIFCKKIENWLYNRKPKKQAAVYCPSFLNLCINLGQHALLKSTNKVAINFKKIWCT